jgi:GH15 family glucan-1,4-alpha-glucosidase
MAAVLRLRASRRFTYSASLDSVVVGQFDVDEVFAGYQVVVHAVRSAPAATALRRLIRCNGRRVVGDCTGMSSVPIAAHALVSDCHSAALITVDGSVDWLCFPRFDSPSVFGRMLDDAAGHWSIRPAGQYKTSRRYLDRTLVLETTFRTATSTVTLTDALAMGPDNEGHALGKGAPHLLIRSVSCVEGSVDLEVSYAPRPEYGLLRPLLSEVDGGVTARGGAEWLVLSTPAAMRLADSTATAGMHLTDGDTIRFALHRSTLDEQPARVWAQEELSDRLAATIDAWRSWSGLHQQYEGPWADLVHHSGRVLQGLTFQPSGAVVAAATTSLPEGVGGERNWDYRYSWVRDASFTMEALWVAACPDEANDFFAFMTTAAAAAIGPGTPLQIMFGVGGEHDLTERTLPHLRGWRDSRPVRVGNGAWNQQQIDVYGELLGAAHRLANQITAMDADMRAFLVALADTAAVRWRDTDQGIWEVRGESRHFLYSKVMCWVALDRAIKLADRLHAGHKVGTWQVTRDEIWETVAREGWNPRVGAFTQYFGSADLDASNLMMPLVGFLPADHPRMLATIEAIAAGLTDERGLVYRYRTEGGVDGLAGEEGTFLLCTFWLAQALAEAGQVQRAREVFERAISYRNDVGLLAEEIDPATGELLGNFPQAFSHIGLVNAAWAISQARNRTKENQS